MPAAIRPQRPARWLAEACEIGSIGSRCTLVRWLYREIRAMPGVDDVADARHGQRGLGDVGGQHDPRGRCAAAKTRCCSAADSRAYSGSTSTVAPAGGPAGQRLGGVADLPLAGQEHQDVAGPSRDSSSTASTIAWHLVPCGSPSCVRAGVRLSGR